MNKWAISLVLMILLTGCSAEPEIERGMALRSSLLKSENSSFDATVCADYGNYSSRFVMHCGFDAQGAMEFTVVEPEAISGIRGQVSASGGALTFDDTVLCFELLTDEQISPVCAPWILMKTLRSGYLTAAGVEDEFLRLTIDDSYEEDALTLDIWMDENNQPVRGEILWDGRRILSLEIGSFVIS